MSQAIKSVEFVRSCTSLDQLPDPVYSEVAFIGRSNVGKSSLINALLNRKKLAKTSSTPGRTQEINYYKITTSKNKEGHFVDLPGFGYAKFSKEKREKINRLIVEFVRKRENLTLVCLLNDCRREAKEDELALRKLMTDCSKEMLVVATKFDKLKKNERATRKESLKQQYELPSNSFFPFSIREKNGALLTEIVKFF